MKKTLQQNFNCKTKKISIKYEAVKLDDIRYFSKKNIKKVKITLVY